MRRTPASRRRLFALLPLALLLACAHQGGLVGGYAPDPEGNLKLGDEELEARNFQEAERFYEYVRSRYPYVEAAREAELRLADLEFAREAYEVARERYEAFVKLHPTHPKVDYAAYRTALTHYKSMPSTFVILPPAEEKDQAEVRAAARAFQLFLEQHPQSEHRAEAERMLTDVRRRLAEHELYAARFYAKRGRWKGVVRRLETLLKEYPGTKYDEEALFKLHDAYVELKDADRARETLERVEKLLPNTPAAERARKLKGS